MGRGGKGCEFNGQTLRGTRSVGLLMSSAYRGSGPVLRARGDEIVK